MSPHPRMVWLKFRRAMVVTLPLLLLTAASASVRAVAGPPDAAAAGGVSSTVDNPDDDVDVLYIERTPRLSFDPDDVSLSSGLPAPDQAMTYLAHVKNWGSHPVVVPYLWRFDGAVSVRGSVRIAPRSEVRVPFRWKWQAANHTLEFVADPDRVVAESSELNNSVFIRTNAVLLGLWVERSVYDRHHRDQHLFNDGANGFEDWAQRLVRRWNELFARARYPVSPDGILDRIALDEVVVVPDGALPLHGGLAGNNPDPTDRTVDMQWGIPWSAQDYEEPDGFYRLRWNGEFFLATATFHELNHARYLPDLYSFDVNGNGVAVTQNGARVAGTGFLPRIAFDNVYYNKWRDVMGAGPLIFDAYSAALWNRKAHRRGRGNENAPPDFGSYFADVPARNHVRFVDQNSRPLAGARVDVYQEAGDDNFDDHRDATYTTDADGSIVVPGSVFSSFSSAGGEVLLKVTFRRQAYFLFQEITDFNLELFRGRTGDAFYSREIDLRDNPAEVRSDAWLGNYFGREDLHGWVTSRSDAALDFAWGRGRPAPGVPADHFSVSWQRDVAFTTGFKTFEITADGGVQLFVDGRLVFDRWNNRSRHTWRPVIFTDASAPFVNAGRSVVDTTRHRVEVRYRHGSGAARIRLAWADWKPPRAVPIGAWRGDYYSTTDLSGYITSRVEAAIANEYRDGSADPVQFPDGWSVRWVGQWDFQDRPYTFHVIADGGARVFIDGQLALDHWDDTGRAEYSFSRNLAAGRHTVELHYFDASGAAAAHLTWR